MPTLHKIMTSRSTGMPQLITDRPSYPSVLKAALVCQQLTCQFIPVCPTLLCISWAFQHHQPRCDLP